MQVVVEAGEAANITSSHQSRTSARRKSNRRFNSDPAAFLLLLLFIHSG
jgi:hypothetical protein